MPVSFRKCLVNAFRDKRGMGSLCEYLGMGKKGGEKAVSCLALKGLQDAQEKTPVLGNVSPLKKRRLHSQSACSGAQVERIP